MGTPFDLDAIEALDEQRKTAANVRAEAAKADANWVMSDKRGRRFVYGLLAEAGLYRTSFTGDALQSAFNEGGREKGLRLLSRLLAYCPDEYSMMQKESNGA